MRCATHCVDGSCGGCATLPWRTPAQVVDYCKQTTCRHVTIAGHFGEKHKARDICDGMCDACTSMLRWPHEPARVQEGFGQQ
jgi:superfamily II DNA helicase RecQ